MKKLIYGTLFLAIVGIGVVGCKKVVFQNDNLEKLSKTNNSNKSLINSVLTESQIDSIAIYHNIYLTSLAGNFSASTGKLRNEFVSRFLNIASTNSTASQEELLEFMDSCEVNNHNFVLSNTEDLDVEIVFNNMRTYLNNNSTYNFTDIRNYINIQKDYARLNVNNEGELDIVLAFLATTEKSCFFWMPSNLGGSGIGEDFIDALDDDIIFPVSWGAIAYADGAGAAGVLIRTIYLAGGGPLGWGTIVGAIGWGAAWSSGSALLYQLM